MFRRKTIFDILREADEDNNDTSADTSGTDDNGGGDDTSSSDDSAGTDDNADDTGGDDEDFNIDTSLGDDDKDGDDDDSGDDSDSGDDTSSDMDSSSSDSGDGEPVKANTDIFSSLTAEEQKIKIRKLKEQFHSLFVTAEDIKAKIDDLNTDESNLDVVTRLSAELYTIKEYIRDYLLYHFDNKSFIENDIVFNRFLAIMNSIQSVLEDLAKVSQIKNGKESE